MRTADIKRKYISEAKNYDGLKQKKTDLENQISRETDDGKKSDLRKALDEINRALSDSERVQSDLKASLDKRGDLVSRTVDTIEKCMDYRRAVRNVFDSALDRVRSEGDADVKPLAQSLRNKYEASKSGHEIKISDTDKARQNCKDERP